MARLGFPISKEFLVPVKPLSILFRAKFRDALKKTDLFAQVPHETWSQDWVVHCQPVGNGMAALKYLAPYIFRVAISNNRILKLEDGQVTYRYTASDTGKTRYCTVIAEEFIRRFLQHVLPKGFIKVRYYGFFSSGNRHRLHLARKLLNICNFTKAADIDETNAAPSALRSSLPKVWQGNGDDPDAPSKTLSITLRGTYMDSISVHCFTRGKCTVGFALPATG